MLLIETGTDSTGFGRSAQSAKTPPRAREHHTCPARMSSEFKRCHGDEVRLNTHNHNPFDGGV